jgi:hypothetical protein
MPVCGRAPFFVVPYRNVAAVLLLLNIADVSTLGGPLSRDDGKPLSPIFANHFFTMVHSPHVCRISDEPSCIFLQE